MQARLLCSTAVACCIALIAGAASATPVATTKQQRELYGRTFLEPDQSTNFVQFGSDGKGEYYQGMKLLARLYPQYLTFTTVAKALHDPTAVSVGADGFPAWDKRDTGDGLPLNVTILTDKTVPDRHKQYVSLMFSHSAEGCGREGVIRTVEDLLIWATEDPGHTITDGRGLTGQKHTFTAAELLRKTKIYVVSTSPDGWAAGDGSGAGYSQYNGAGVNSNRVAYQDGWVFPPDSSLYRNGYTTLTQPEGAAITRYLLHVRHAQLHGRPFATAADIHGPVPSGMILLHDQGNSPMKLEEDQDLGLRVQQRMDAALAKYLTKYGADAYNTAMTQAGAARDQLIDTLPPEVGGSAGAYGQLPLRWATLSNIWDQLSYTVSGSWGGWMNSDAGLGAHSLSYEINCITDKPWDPASMQLFVDNVRAIAQTTIVDAAAMASRHDVRPAHVNLKGTVGFYDSGRRVTDADGNPSPPPRSFPGNPFWRAIRQTHYDVSNTDYYRDLRGYVSSPIVRVGRRDLRNKLRKVDSLAISDATVGNRHLLERFVRSGGNLVLTDRALRLLPKITKLPRSAVGRRFGYVGYADLKRPSWLTNGLSDRARQLYDPVGIGYPLLMERDNYWSSGTSPTKNDAPIWSVDRDAWKTLGGATFGSADPPATRKTTYEGNQTNRTVIGILRHGKGRIVIFGALLPRPTERYSHWFGLDPYTISIAGQTMLLRTLAYRN